MLKRALSSQIKKDLQEKMVFLGGPRQVGKTTLSQSLIPKFSEGHPAYLNWDDVEQRKKIMAKDWPRDQKLIVLDEVLSFETGALL